MNQLTIRGFDRELESCLRQLADDERISLNRAALTLMRRGAGLTASRPSDDRVGSDLDSFIGGWSEEDEAELMSAVEAFDRIDPGLWK